MTTTYLTDTLLDLYGAMCSSSEREQLADFLNLGPHDRGDDGDFYDGDLYRECSDHRELDHYKHLIDAALDAAGIHIPETTH